MDFRQQYHVQLRIIYNVLWEITIPFQLKQFVSHVLLATIVLLQE